MKREAEMEQVDAKQSLNPMALSVADAVRLLSRVGGQPVRVSMIEADLVDGAPANPDGTINLVHYSAWLLRELASSD
jgi:hypothetical protein